MLANLRYLVGIDEAGRGPIAGPVAVGVVSLDLAKITDQEAYFAENFAGLRDSKKLSEKKRESFLAKIAEEKKLENLDFAVTLVSNKIIDEKGIVFAIKSGIKECLNKLNLEAASCLIKLDGGLKAPENYQNQETIVRGDESEAIIALASICAKVIRDKWLLNLAKKYPNYGLEKHKGYGTAAHYAALKKFGLSPVHRRSFLKNLKNK